MFEISRFHAALKLMLSRPRSGFGQLKVFRYTFKPSLPIAKPGWGRRDFWFTRGRITCFLIWQHRIPFRCFLLLHLEIVNRKHVQIVRLPGTIRSLLSSPLHNFASGPKDVSNHSKKSEENFPGWACGVGVKLCHIFCSIKSCKTFLNYSKTNKSQVPSDKKISGWVNNRHSRSIAWSGRYLNSSHM